jgi:hypothetical protein
VTVLERPLGERGTKEYVNLLERFGQDDAKQFIDSFEPSGIKFDVLTKENTVYRWHNDDSAAKQFGRFVSEEMISDPNAARAALDLSQANRTLFLDEFKVVQGTPVFAGPVRVAAGVKPGNQLFLVTGAPESVLKFVRRIKP